MKNFKNISREIEKAIINKENDKRFNDKKLFLYSDRKKKNLHRRRNDQMRVECKVNRWKSVWRNLAKST